MVLFRITENEPSKMHNVRPYVYSRPWCALLREVSRCICGYVWKHVSVWVCVLKRQTTSSGQEMPEVT